MLGIFSDILKTLSLILGADVEALKLLISVLLGYLLAIIYRKHFYGESKNLKHSFFILTGLLLAYLNYGTDIIHSLVAVVFTYGVMATMGGTSTTVGVVFIFNMLYLLIGYFVMSTDSYDINWTMPHCILVLKLIGVAFDYFDGQQRDEKLGADNKKLKLEKLPEPLEFFGFSYFPATLMVGPQFSMRRYQSYVSGEFGDPKDLSKPPRSEKAAYVRCGLGLLYLAIFQILGMFVSDDYLLSQDFYNLSFVRKHLLMGLWGRYTLYKYISCWLLAEGACILFGISHNGKDENGEIRWNGLENVKLQLFENTTEFNHYIKSFNVNTNYWVAHYIYKRLKFLGNRHLSQIGALLFLALWHGYHSGYFITFYMEFVIIFFERDIVSIVKSNKKLNDFFNQRMVVLALRVLLRVYTFVFMGFCLLPFALLRVDKYWQAFGYIGYSGLLLFGLYPILWGPILNATLRGKKQD